MDIRKIEYFITVAETQNISSAAAKLNISHQGLSQQIKALEFEAGVRLLNRTANRVELTEAGKYFVDTYGPVLHEIGECNRKFKRYVDGMSDTTRIAYFSGIGYKQTIAPIIDSLRASSFKKIELVSTDISRELLMLKAGEVDAVIIPLQDGEIIPGFENRVLMSVPLKILIAKGHAWEKYETIPVSEIKKAKMLVYDNRNDEKAKPFMSDIDIEGKVYVTGFDDYMIHLASGEAFGINFDGYSSREWDIITRELPDEYKRNMDIVLVYREL